MIQVHKCYSGHFLPIICYILQPQLKAIYLLLHVCLTRSGFVVARQLRIIAIIMRLIRLPPPTELESANYRPVGTRRAGGIRGPLRFWRGGGRVCLPHYYSNLGFQTFLRPWNSEYKRQMSEANFLNADISLHTRVHSKVFYYIVCNLSFFAAFSNFRCRGLDYELWQKKSIFNKLF